MLTSVVAPLVGGSLGKVALQSSSNADHPFTTSPRQPAVPPVSNAGPHPGTLDIYEVAPGGATTEDPSAAYDSLSYEPIINVYQTLVAYNGSSTASFVPELATCVPGSAECTHLYGSTLVTNNASTGLPQYFTFVLDSAAHFYDPSTGNSWGVYPSDVMFSLSRTMSFAEQPGVGSQPGWIQTQALLQYGGYGIHRPWNNTPAPVLSSMLVNDTRFCPAAAMTSDNGCITFNAVGSGSDWPFFLQLVADPLGAGIQPCGWYTHVGAGLPGFVGAGANVPNGDGPCLLPGGAHSTSDSSFQHFVSTVAPSAWDAVQEAAANNPNNPQPAVQWSMVGSGPYYALTVSKAIGYVLKANPAYQAPTGCAGQPGCEPLPGSYQGTINVYWEQDDTTGVAEYQAGQADLAGIQLPAHVSTLKSLLSAGKINLTYIPTLSIFFKVFNFDFNVSLLNQDPGNPGTTNVPGDFLSHIAVRGFIVNAYPYATINATLLRLNNISIGFDYGGAIPKYLGNYYAYNITWPAGDPVSNPNVTGSAAWWWAQGNNASSPYYDSELSACSVSNPCVFALTEMYGADNTSDSYLVREIASLSGGRLLPYVYQLPRGVFCFYNQDCVPEWSTVDLGWAPDFPDPTDYVTPLYYPDSTYTYGTSLAEELALSQYNQPWCPYVGNYSQPSAAWAALVYYHNLHQLSDGCQGVAYNISLYWYYAAAPLAIGPERTLDYQMASQLDALLNLDLWEFQENLPETFAPWISVRSLNSNPIIGASGDNTWYTVGYTSGVEYATFSETGLAPGTDWSVTVGGTTQSSTSPSVTFLLAPSSYNYSIGFVTGNEVTPAAGSVNLTAGPATVPVAFSPFSPSTAVPVTISANGLETGTGWSVLLTGSPPERTSPTTGVPGLGLISTQGQSITIMTPPHTTLYFTASGAIGYDVSGGTGTLTTGAAGTALTVTYTPLLFYTYGLNFSETGLSPGNSWIVTVGGVSQVTTSPSVTFYLRNGTYGISAGAVGWTANPANGSYRMNGSTLPQGTIVGTRAVAFTYLGYIIDFNESGLPATAGNWTVSANGITQSASAATSRITFAFPSSTQAVTYLVTSPPNYTVHPVAGTLVMNASQLTVDLTFTTTLGTITFTDLPAAGYSIWINGQEVVRDGNSSTYTQSDVPQGTVSYEIQVPGYFPLWNNVTIVGGQTATISVSHSLTPIPGNPGPSWTFISTLTYVLTVVLGAVIVVLVALYVFRPRRVPPRPPQPQSELTPLPPGAPPAH